MDEELQKQDVAATLTRYIDESDRLRRQAKKDQQRLVRLEASVRRHALRECSCRNERECLARLFRLVPVQPRRKVRKAG